MLEKLQMEKFIKTLLERMKRCTFKEISKKK